jgi:hypothetical protein
MNAFSDERLEQMTIMATHQNLNSIRFYGSDYSTDKQFRLFSLDR